jgi:NAD(P)-dependent dehydrogenase (short-subunit alcohol dehydrogenase family)
MSDSAPPVLDLKRAADPGRRLEGKVAIVTGAGMDGDLASVGMATAMLFADQGASVGIMDVSPERAARTAGLIADAGGASAVAVGDVTRAEDCARSVAEIADRYGRLDILVNSAAITGGGNADEAMWNRVLAVDLTGAMLMSKHSLPLLRAAGGGAIVNVSSIAAIRGMGAGSYAAAKAGLIGLTYDLAYSHGRDGIRVNCIAPGHLFTPMGDQGGDDLRQRRRRAGLLGTEGTAWDAAWAALFLASDESRWITGVVLPVDAGTTSTTPLAAGNLDTRP